MSSTLHNVLEQFKELDPRGTGKIRRDQFEAVLLLIGLSSEDVTRLLPNREEHSVAYRDVFARLSAEHWEEERREKVMFQCATFANPHRSSDSEVFWIPKRLILVRHGESEGNIDHTIYKNVADGLLHLTPRGWDQATCAGNALRDLIGDEQLKFQVSPYVRTRETFNAIAKAWPERDNLKWEEDPRLREQDFGNFQDVAQIKNCKEESRRFGPFYYRMPNGESPADVYERLSSFFESMYRFWDRHQDQLESLNHVLVCHGVTIAVFLMRMFKYSVDDFHKYENFANCEFCVLERLPSGRYSHEAMYCIRPSQQEDGSWLPVRGPRRIRKDAGRFDRAIYESSPTEQMKSELEKRMQSKTHAAMLEKTFQPHVLAFTCNEVNRVETLIETSGAEHADDDLGIQRDWYVIKVNGKDVTEGTANEQIEAATATGKAYTVLFMVPP